MQNIVEIKNHIKSVRDTAQITKAMELISVAKMHKAAEKFNCNIRYFELVRNTMKDIIFHLGEVTHRYFTPRKADRTAFVVIASDNGLAGDYNHRVLSYAKDLIDKVEEKSIFTIGQMAREFFMREGVTPDVEFLYCAQDPNIIDARRITADLVELYDNNLVDKICIIFTQSEGNVNHPRCINLLPITKEDFEDAVEEIAGDENFEFEPSPEVVFDILVPQYMLGIVYSTLIQAVKCEHSERMRTMNSATRNANEVLEKLELDFHRARQAQITTELTEITSANLSIDG